MVSQTYASLAKEPMDNMVILSIVSIQTNKRPPMQAHMTKDCFLPK